MSTAETSSEPRQPSRLEKNKNTGYTFPVDSCTKPTPAAITLHDVRERQSGEASVVRCFAVCA